MSEVGDIVELIPRLRRYARALVADRSQAEDLVQDTLERAWAKQHLFRDGTDLRAWLFTLMHNVHVNRLRATRVSEPLDDARPELQQSATHGDLLTLRDVDRALGRLPPEQREALLLVTLEEMSYAQTARALGVPVGTVMSPLPGAREAARNDARPAGGDATQADQVAMSEQRPVAETDLHALVDGELDAARRAEVEHWLAEHPDDAARVEDFRRINDALRSRFEDVLAEPVPDYRRAVPVFSRVRALAKFASWTVLGIAVGLAAGWGLRGWSGRAAHETPSVALHAAVAHATYSPEVRHPVEVGANEEAHLVAWLSKRLGYRVRAPDLSADGFSLVGGRLLPGDSTLRAGSAGMPAPAAHFMYQCSRGRRITLYLQPEPARHDQTAFRFAREANVSVFYWVDRDLAYALSSVDVGREELLNVASSVYRQLNP
jgi:RNA polymerase sigma factor (sigma-70 family)